MDDAPSRLLERLREGAVGVGRLARDLDSTPAAVREAIAALESAGVVIECGEDTVALAEPPAYGPAVAAGLTAPFEVEYHETIDSTNERARTLAVAGAADVVVLADRQTGGRGRRDRTWSSPSGGVWLSIVLRPALDRDRWSLYTLAAAVAVAEAARAVAVPAGIKWPNDVEVDSHKLAGILTETGATAAGDPWVVVGVGINANVDPDALRTDRPATSLAAERGTQIDRHGFTQQLLETVDSHRRAPAGVLPAWRRLATTLDRRVRVATPAGPVVGTAVDVTETGALVIQTDAGRETVTVGDCEHLRSAT